MTSEINEPVLESTEYENGNLVAATIGGVRLVKSPRILTTLDVDRETVERILESSLRYDIDELTAERDQLAQRLREYDETHMELPLDADGVPIRVGDTLEYVYENLRFVRKVVAVSSNEFAWEDSDGDFGIRGVARFHRHVDPRTIVDVLADFAADVENGRNDRETAMRYADEIRELLEVDDD